MLRLSALALPLIAILAVSAGASSPPTYKDIPFLERTEIGARWAGMGGVCIATVDDGTAIWSNPAGLGKIRRIELLGTLTNSVLGIETDWLGRKSSSSISTTRFQSLCLAYPFPTYRGSLVAAAGITRVVSFDQYLNRYGTGDYHDIEEKKVVLSAWSGAIALQVSPNVFIGGEAHFFTGDLTYHDELYPWGERTTPAIFAQGGDLSGHGGTVGMVYTNRFVSIGIALKTPQRITVEGEEVWIDDMGTGRNPPVKYHVDLPFSGSIGIAVMPPNFVVALDVTYTDWHQLGFPGGIRDDAGNFIYDPTTDIRFGVEYGIPLLPLRLRAGYAYVPMALNRFRIEKNRRGITLGAGTVIESSVAVDIAWVHTSFERSSPPDDYREKRTLDKGLLTLTYRF